MSCNSAWANVYCCMLYTRLKINIMLCYVMLCYVMLCYVMLCYVMLCYVMLCYVMLCYVMLSIYTAINIDSLDLEKDRRT